MEPQMSDYYNTEPHVMRMIENMNDELSESQKENEELKKKVKLLEDNNCGRPLFEKTVISQNEISKYTLIEEEIREQLYNIMVKSVDNDEEELDFRYLFDHENDYIDILKSNLLNVSHEWCEFRIKNILEKFVSLLFVDEYWWGNLINTDGLSNIIINNIINTIITGNIESESGYQWYATKSEIHLNELYIIKCEICNEYSSYTNFPNTQTDVCCYCAYAHSSDDDD